MANKEHNEWRGLTEGDMAEELAELEHFNTGKPYADCEQFWYDVSVEDAETVRWLWWENIGRYDK